MLNFSVMLEGAKRWTKRKTGEFFDAAGKSSDKFNHVIAGALALGTAATFAREQGELDVQNDKMRAERIAADKLAAYEEELRQERKRSIQETTPDFEKQVTERIEKREKDVTQVWLNGFSPDKELGGLSKFEYLTSHFFAEGSGTIPEAAAAPLRSLMPALVAAESRFNTHAVSHTNAFSAVQAVPGTFSDWYTFGKGKKIPDGKYAEYRKEFIGDFKQQVEFLNWYFPYMYDRLLADENCVKELGKIQEQYFPDDVEGFERYFIAPLLLNAYNAGFGTMKRLVEGVGTKIRSFTDTQPHSIPNQKYLAFYLMTEDTDFRDPSKQLDGLYFDTEKHLYVREILAFDELMAKMIREGGPKIEFASNTKKSLD